MRKGLMIAAVATAPILALAPLPAAAHSAVRASSVRTAIVTSVSCAPGGDCAAGGLYYDAAGAHAFVLTERNGRWGTAIEVPGLAALSPARSSINSVSCVRGGCVAGGYYQDATSLRHAFVTSEKNGRWRRLVTVFSASKAEFAVPGVGAVSCSWPESCTAGGGRPAFVVSEVHGRWGQARQFFPAEDQIGRVEVSCASAGNCSASWKTFVVSERNGHWGKPMALPGLSALGTGAGAGITWLSCTAAASCAAGGNYRAHLATEVFVASKRNGRWGKAIEIPGFTKLNQAGTGNLNAVTCFSAGNCEAGGTYAAPADFAGGVFAPFVASERHYRWGRAIEVPGIPPTSSGICEPDSDKCVAGKVLSVSCAPGGTCADGGWYDTPAINGQVAFVAVLIGGRWTKSTQIPGLAHLDTGQNFSVVNSVSCTPAGLCAAGGSYSNTKLRTRPAFVVAEQDGTWGQAHTIQFRR